MHKLNLLIQYIKYLQQARNKYDVHPPFLYDLITLVFEDKERYPDFAAIEQLKRGLLNRRDRLEVNDLGAGSSSGRNRIRPVKTITRFSSKPKKYGRLLYRLSRYLKPDTMLELGTAMGISSAYLAMGNRKSTLTTVEGCANIAHYARLNIKSLGLQNVEVINGNFDQVLPRYLESVDHLDLAFIDGNHREAPTINYFEQCLLKTVNTSCFIFDDIHWSEGMGNAWNFIRNHPKVTLSLDLYFMGLVFFRKELSKQHFVIRF